MKSTAVFLDRDGTIIGDPGYIAEADQVRLLPGAADALRRLADLGHLLIMVSNQSGVARGLFDEAALASVHARVEELLRAQGALLDGAYYCPYLDGSEATVERYRRNSELRKPSPGMLLQAARERGIDLPRSWMIGDSPRDVEAGRSAGCRTILIVSEPSRDRPVDGDGQPRATYTVRSLAEAADLLEREMKREHEPKTRSAPAEGDDEVVALLRGIRDQIDRAQRPTRQQDFSLLRLGGSLVQMLAIVAAIWGVVGLLDERDGAGATRLLLACFLQLASISAFAIDRFR